MTNFDYEVMERKSISRGAYHKKNGSKSKKCHLPSDDLTPAQMRKLNGPCVTYNLSKALSYAEFKALPGDYRVDYINGLNERFGVPLTRISEDLFGLHRTYLWRALKDANLYDRLSDKFGHKGVRLKADEKAAWEQFCGIAGDEEVFTAEPAEAEAPAMPAPKTSHAVEDPRPVGKFENTLSELPDLLCGGEIRMSGLASELLPALVRMIGGNDAHMSVHLRFVRKEEETNLGKTESDTES